MSKRILLASVALFVFAGCSTVGHGQKAQSADSGSIFGDDLVASAPMMDATPPDQMEVSWTDNGQPIRPLSEPGKAYSMKVPATKVQKRANLNATK